MDIKAIKDLASTYSVEDLAKMADDLENQGSCALKNKEDAGELLGDLLQAIEVRMLIDQGLPLHDAIREFSKRVREVLK